MTTYNVKLSVRCRECLSPLDGYQRGEEILVEPCCKCIAENDKEVLKKCENSIIRNW